MDFLTFFLQIQVPQTEGGLGIIHQTVTTPIQAGYTSILLDLEVFDFQNLLPKDNNILWERINTLRDQKIVYLKNALLIKLGNCFHDTISVL